MKSGNRWIASALLVTPAAHRAAAAQLYAGATGRAEDATPDTFIVELAAIDGGELVTHYACRTRIREETLAALPQLAAAIPGGLWHVTAHDDDTPEERDARLSAEDFLATHDLALYTPEDEI
jgi:hypothetical protein